MNDIEKLSPDMLKLQTLRARQTAARQARELRKKQRLATAGISSASVLDELDPAVILNALPNNGDGQENTLSREELLNGIKVQIASWADMRGEPYVLSFAIDDDEFAYPVTVESHFEPPIEVVIPLGNHAFSHGVHTVSWHSYYTDDGNIADSQPANFFVDILDPNLGRQPDPVLLPADLPAEGLTPDYLDQHGGVGFTLPTFSDNRLEDTYSFFINAEPVLVDQPAMAPFSVLVLRAVFDGLPEGEMELTYTLTDRAGNRTVESLTRMLFLHKTPVPVLRAPTIPEGPIISLGEARDGVSVFQDYDEPRRDDFVTVHWQGLAQESFFYPNTFVDVPFADVKQPGETYTATVFYELNRNGTVYRSPEITVEVDLETTGPVNPEEPDIVNPNLVPLELTSSTGAVNAIVPADINLDATITVELYTPVNVGDMIQVYYVDLTNPVGAAVQLTQADIDAGDISVVLPWAMINAAGNGSIPSFYRIYPDAKPENAQQAPTTLIEVTVFNMADLPVAEFPDRDQGINVINCGHEPWIRGVNVRMTYPGFLEGDRLTLNWVLGQSFPAPDGPLPTDPLEPSRRDFPHVVTTGEEAAGVVTMNVPWGEHLSAVEKGSIIVEWMLERGEVTGSSPGNYVRYSRQRAAPGNPVCPDDD